MSPSSSLDALFIALILALTFISIIIKLSAKFSLSLQILKMCYLHQIQNKNMDF